MKVFNQWFANLCNRSLMVTTLAAVLVGCQSAGFKPLPSDLELQLNPQGVAKTETFMVPETRSYQMSLVIREKVENAQSSVDEKIHDHQRRTLNGTGQVQTPAHPFVHVTLKERSSGKAVINEQLIARPVTAPKGERRVGINKVVNVPQGLYILEFELKDSTIITQNVSMTLNMHKSS